VYNLTPLQNNQVPINLPEFSIVIVLEMLYVLWKITPAVIFLTAWQYFTAFGAWKKQCDPYSLPH
jgi:hypothetical protein